VTNTVTNTVVKNCRQVKGQSLDKDGNIGTEWVNYYTGNRLDSSVYSMKNKPYLSKVFTEITAAERTWISYDGSHIANGTTGKEIIDNNGNVIESWAWSNGQFSYHQVFTFNCD
jgi:hypothetical protein